MNGEKQALRFGALVVCGLLDQLAKDLITKLCMVMACLHKSSNMQIAQTKPLLSGLDEAARFLGAGKLEQ